MTLAALVVAPALNLMGGYFTLSGPSHHFPASQVKSKTGLKRPSI